MVVDGRAPDPREARSTPEFIALLRLLKDVSGLTFRELSQRAEVVGDVLPRSTIANMLGRTSVPREELLAAFVRACGCGPAPLLFEPSAAVADPEHFFDLESMDDPRELLSRATELSLAFR
ncbi:helix-turn-helix transcriptional regulator, partial [Streptomyces sp. Wh19]|nr:helix-turn-helix transcriptional regulator [Streptomyces sp. Wh19]